MTTVFPSSPEFTGPAYTPARFEGDVYDLVVEGEVPTAIKGTYYQVAPDPQYPPMLGQDIFFNGDGCIHAFTFADGHVDFKRRYVLTERLKAQREARRSLHGVYRNTYTNDPLVSGLSNSTANTNVIVHHGKLLALKEDSHPYALDPTTMETLGTYDFGGQLTSATFTAHPKIDPVTGDMLCFAYEAKGDATPDIVYYEIDKSGRKTKEVWIRGPYAAMIHDFAVTEHYVVFPLMPLTVDLDRIRKGGRHFEWQPGLDQTFGVLPRDGDAKDVRWFTAPNGFQGHTLNAFDDGHGRVYVDMPVASGNVFPFFPQADGYVPPPETIMSRLTRWTFDMNKAGNSLEASSLTDFICEFPRSDDRYMGRPYRHGFVAGLDPRRPYDFETLGPPSWAFMNFFAHVDLTTGKVKSWFADDKTSVQEPAFIPKSAGAAEGEGYLVALVNRLAERATDLLVFDAQHLDDGPIATVKLPVRLRMSLHGNWVPAV
ncbi:carotenoid oxygenase family protein [Segnochrobactrum spirostomi]|uniref:Dioxygenase n=1 Tax=Segnochrobactrum spirostomi TaxID=2608987 RepID=A0A6A7YAX3_9HYPH|nr:carotenoid oxygenase family protein [Segnochrobactrum spirostomi]MQT15101.1 carotenoid oxygenase family protein [Segnochrobactrum spirostomi]